jgi:Ner family transcriptional regulator
LQPEARAWHRQDIIAALKKQGTSLAAVGRSLGFSRATMSWALMKPHPRANAAVAAALGLSMHELWPLWYMAAPSPSPSPSTKPSATRSKESRANKRAA